MPLTDRSDLFASFHEDGFNRLIHHARLQRPSMFNYATRAIAEQPDLLCQVISAHPIVATRNNPVVTIVDPLPVPGTNFGLNFAVQVAECKVDFHPGDEFELPAELGPQLAAQRLAIFVRLVMGFACPIDTVLDSLIPPPPEPGAPPPPDPTEIEPIPTTSLICTTISGFAVGGIRIRNYWNKPYLEPFLNEFEIVDIGPGTLESSLECYVKVVLKLAVLPQLRFLLEQAPMKIVEGVEVNLVPTATSAVLPFNPAIEDDQLKVFIQLEVV